ncbi:hypothetical protein CPB84DRAFT_1750337 [Gymnopilus junonius]|uniref:Uncharacterized protein n=1 Tax=Gymnopilus junonius TaxID=109634 RepID=A0A9P5NDZ4_GYMJU|nr:hypothetical protein CPB84DRAFT_1750337 [Gymnopilus junonius]
MGERSVFDQVAVQNILTGWSKILLTDSKFEVKLNEPVVSLHKYEVPGLPDCPNVPLLFHSESLPIYLHSLLITVSRKDRHIRDSKCTPVQATGGQSSLPSQRRWREAQSEGLRHAFATKFHSLLCVSPQTTPTIVPIYQRLPLENCSFHLIRYGIYGLSQCYTLFYDFPQRAITTSGGEGVEGGEYQFHIGAFHNFNNKQTRARLLPIFSTLSRDERLRTTCLFGSETLVAPISKRSSDADHGAAVEQQRRFFVQLPRVLDGKGMVFDSRYTTRAVQDLIEVILTLATNATVSRLLLFGGDEQPLMQWIICHGVRTLYSNISIVQRYRTQKMTRW